VLRRLVAPAGLVLASILLAALATEAVLRAAGISYPDFFRDDPVIGRSLRPGAHGWWNTEGTSYVEINADGMRDRDHAAEKPPGTFRVAVLGDSYAAAFEVNQDATFWSEIERGLPACPALAGRDVEVLNFGLGGAGTAQQYLMLEDRVWKYRPDVVLLAFLTANDVSDNSRKLKGSNRAAYFVHDAAGRLVLDPQFVEKREKLRVGPLDDLWQAAFNRSRVLQVASEARRRVRALTRAADVPPNMVPGSEAGIDHQIYKPPTDPEWQRAWAVTEDLLRLLIADVRAHHAGFLLASLTNGIQVDPDLSKRERYAAALGVPDLLYPDRRIEALARAENVPFAMLVPPLGTWAAEHQTCVHGFENATPCGGPWNEHGHRVAGEVLAAALCRDVIPTLPAAGRGADASR
jgi:hypothetical protein